MLAAEQEQGPLALVLGCDRGEVAVELGLELGVARLLDERNQLDEIVSTTSKVAPRGELGAEIVGLAEDALGCALIVPEPWRGRLRIQLGKPALLGVEVKDAPRSTGSAPRDPGWRWRPPSSGPGDPGAGAAAAR